MKLTGFRSWLNMFSKGSEINIGWNLSFITETSRVLPTKMKGDHLAGEKHLKVKWVIGCKIVLSSRYFGELGLRENSKWNV